MYLFLWLYKRTSKVKILQSTSYQELYDVAFALTCLLVYEVKTEQDLSRRQRESWGYLAVH